MQGSLLKYHLDSQITGRHLRRGKVRGGGIEQKGKRSHGHGQRVGEGGIMGLDGKGEKAK